ncbi:hypothetical protein PENTCL1PPCAC_26739, partial [Pristionchus entomophagus]
MWLLLLLITPSYAANCSGLFTQDDRDGEYAITEILAAHNKLRSSIALGQYGAMNQMFPGASNMERMVKTSDVTQQACDSWSSEFQQHGLNRTTMTWDQFSAGIGHATQMAWATSSHLGCGVALCGDGNKQALVVCQYQKMGNMIGSPIYLEGGACTKCPDYAPMCDEAHGLCIPTSATVSPP